MKIKTLPKSYDEVMAIKPPKHFKPMKTNLFWQTLLKIICKVALIPSHFTHNEVGMEKLGKDEPALILMNHSAFTDFEIAYSLLYPRKFNTVAAFETFMGLDWIMKPIGIFPTKKYISDPQLIRDIKYCLVNNKSSVLMFPEAVYTLDGTGLTLPASLAKLIKLLGVPLCMLQTNGVYLHVPAYGYVENRKVPLHAELRYVLSPEEIKQMSVQEIQAVIDREFSYDDFRWQKENNIIIDEPFRADGLHTILYKCPHCQKEGKMESNGTTLTCTACGKKWELTEKGYLQASEGETYFDHVPDWYKWERECVRKEILDGNYGFNVPCDIMMIVDTKALYKVGSGRISHNKEEGFHLTSADGKIDLYQSPDTAYTCEAIPYFYQIDDVIGISTNHALYFAFPTEQKEVVVKAKFATEEIFKILTAEKQAKRLEKKA
jgi:1-acyl-sn-glycerol-3-phosphate acyltransferase